MQRRVADNSLLTNLPLRVLIQQLTCSPFARLNGVFGTGPDVCHRFFQ